MDRIRTEGFTAKDLFNASSSTPLKDVVGTKLDITDLCVTEKNDGTVAAYLKATDGTVYATISTSVISQIDGLVELLPATVVAVSKKSNGNRDYLQLELV